MPRIGRSYTHGNYAVFCFVYNTYGSRKWRWAAELRQKKEEGRVWPVVSDVRAEGPRSLAFKFFFSGVRHCWKMLSIVRAMIKEIKDEYNGISTYNSFTRR